MDFLSGWCKSKRRLDGYTAIVTGSNTGIGKETARDLYYRGARVIMACRNIKTAEEAKRDILETSHHEHNNPDDLILENLDLCSFESVRKFAHRILEKERKIQILINNAGVMMCPESRTEDGFETHIGSNHLAPALLTLLLLPRLIESAPSRIVFVSSLIHCIYTRNCEDLLDDKPPHSPLFAYSGSKAASILFARALAIKLKTPRCGAQTTIYCAVDENCAHESGLYYSDCGIAMESRFCRSEDNALKLWNLTLKSLNLERFNPFQQKN